MRTSTLTENINKPLPNDADHTLMDNIVGQKSGKTAEQLARELHDRLGPALSATQFKVDHLCRQDTISERELVDLQKQVQQSQYELRLILADLRQQNYAGELSVMDVLREGNKRLRKNIETIFEFQISRTLNPAIEREIAHVAKEALINLEKHSEATRARILWRCESKGLFLMVADNGKGFDKQAIGPDSYGITGMQERADSIGATFQIKSKLNEGTVLKCTLDTI